MGGDGGKRKRGEDESINMNTCGAYVKQIVATAAAAESGAGGDKRQFRVKIESEAATTAGIRMGNHCWFFPIKSCMGEGESGGGGATPGRLSVKQKERNTWGSGLS